jgi:hypothetical protein
MLESPSRSRACPAKIVTGYLHGRSLGKDEGFPVRLRPQSAIVVTVMLVTSSVATFDLYLLATSGVH